MSTGVYYIRDKKFGSMFPKYELCKIGYSYNVYKRLKQFPNSKNLEIVSFKLFGKNATIEDMLKEEQKCVSSIEGICGYVFKNRYVVNAAFPFPKKFDDTTKLLKRAYGNDIFNGWTEKMILSKNKMFRYFDEMRRDGNRYHNRYSGNWGSTEWFVLKK